MRFWYSPVVWQGQRTSYIEMGVLDPELKLKKPYATHEQCKEEYVRCNHPLARVVCLTASLWRIEALRKVPLECAHHFRAYWYGLTLLDGREFPTWPDARNRVQAVYITAKQGARFEGGLPMGLMLAQTVPEYQQVGEP